MENVTEIECTRCRSIIYLKVGAVHRDYCSDCKSTMRLNWTAKLTNDRRLRTLKKRGIETLK